MKLLNMLRKHYNTEKIINLYEINMKFKIKRPTLMKDVYSKNLESRKPTKTEFTKLVKSHFPRIGDNELNTMWDKFNR